MIYNKKIIKEIERVGKNNNGIFKSDSVSIKVNEKSIKHLYRLFKMGVTLQLWTEGQDAFYLYDKNKFDDTSGFCWTVESKTDFEKVMNVSRITIVSIINI